MKLGNGICKRDMQTQKHRMGFSSTHLIQYTEGENRETEGEVIFKRYGRKIPDLMKDKKP